MTARSFQRDGNGGLTDGKRCIPKRRPATDVEWEALDDGMRGLGDIQAHEWDRFVCSAIGVSYPDVKGGWRELLTHPTKFRRENLIPAIMDRLHPRLRETEANIPVTSDIEHSKTMQPVPIEPYTADDVGEMSTNDEVEPEANSTSKFQILPLDEAIQNLVASGDYSIPEAGAIRINQREICRLSFRGRQLSIVQPPNGERGKSRTTAGGYYIFADDSDAIAFAEGILSVEEARDRTINRGRINRRGDVPRRINKVIGDNVR